MIYYDCAAHEQNQTGAGIWCKRTTSSQNKDPGGSTQLRKSSVTLTGTGVLGIKARIPGFVGNTSKPVEMEKGSFPA